MAAIQNVVGDLAPGSYGYGFLLSGRGVYLADPQESKVRNQVTFEEDAREARDPGMAALGAAVRKCADRLTQGSRPAMGAVRKLLRDGASASLHDHFEAESRSMAELALGPDVAEGLTALKQKRPPNFGA